MSIDAPWRLDETTLGDLIDRTSDPADAGFDVAVLPFGCTEPHNLHLPYGTDTIEALEIGDRICHAAWRAGARVALLPAIPYGTTTNQSELRLTLNLMPTTILAIVRDLLASLSNHGIRKVVLLNSHGGNDLKWMLRELHGEFDPDVKLFLIDWFRTMRDAASEIFENADDHAGEMETSILLATRPELAPNSSLATPMAASLRMTVRRSRLDLKPSKKVGSRSVGRGIFSRRIPDRVIRTAPRRRRASVCSMRLKIGTADS